MNKGTKFPLKRNYAHSESGTFVDPLNVPTEGTGDEKRDFSRSPSIVLGMPL